MTVRETAVAGAFYPKTKADIERQLKHFFSEAKSSEKRGIAVVAPHAGYEYSGKIAAIALKCLRKAQSFVILSPNHTGLGPLVSVSDADEWETPLGKIGVDAGIRGQLVKAGIAEMDDLAHIQEHSIEVQLPMLKFLFNKFGIVPVTIMAHDIEQLKRLGKQLAILKKKHDFSVIASSDFSHFVPLKEAKEKDLEAVRKIEELDIDGFYEIVTQRQLSICGFAAITATMQFCKELGIKKAKLLRYGTSAAATGSEARDVGYAAIRFG